MTGGRDPRRSGRPRPNAGRRARTGSRTGFYLTVVGLILALLVIGALIVCFLTSILNISEFATANEGRYTPQELAEAAGIKLGEKIWSVDTKKAERNILETYTEIGSVKIKRELPDRVIFEPVYATAKYYIALYGEYYTLSDSLRVLERVESRSYCTGLRLVCLELPEIRRAVTGEVLTFAAENSVDYIARMLSAVSGSELYSMIDKLSIKSKFECYAIKTDCFKITFGEVKDEILKIKMALRVMEDGGYHTQTGVFVDATDASEVVVAVRKNEKIG
ncbi:MAG: FtsQ-type POTRA domain-containing protein [Clostridia bacterium]|nr:FtsQ-type POTRA domain-containing protein [Clostridia bacterium]